MLILIWGLADGSIFSIGENDGFVVKYDPNGNFLWVRTFGGNMFTDIDAVTNIKVDPSGNVYIAGIFQGDMDIDPELSSYMLSSMGDFDAFLVKYDTDGNLIWGFNMGSIGFDYIYEIVLDDLGNVYAVGSFVSSVDFDPGIDVFLIPSLGSSDGFIAKYDVNGNFLWAKNLGSTSTDHVSAIDLDPLGNILVTGRFDGTVDFDLGAGVAELTAMGGVLNIFIASYDENGEYNWAINLEQTASSSANGIQSDNHGNVYLLSEFLGSVDLDPSALVYNLTSAGSSDIALAKYTTGIVLSNGLLSFDVEKKNNSSHITWTLSSTDQLSGFIIEKSLDGKTFTNLSKIDAQDQVLTYNSLDDNPSMGKNYYRLKIIYENGKEEYSMTRQVTFTNKNNVTLFPNPANDYIQLSLDNNLSPIDITITNLQGKVVKTISNYQSEDKINLSDLSKGIYFIQSNNGTSMKFIIE